MAITQSTLSESLLSNAERSVVRQIYRISQLAEARKMLANAFSQGSVANRQMTTGSSIPKSLPLTTDQEISAIDAYLVNSIARIIGKIQLPKQSAPEA